MAYTSFSVSGFRIQFDSDAPVDVGATDFHVVLRDAQNAQFFYEIDEDVDIGPDDLPQVNVLSPLVYQMAVGDQAVGDDFEFDIGRITRDNGDVHDVLVFRNIQTETDFVFLLAGDPLPALDTLADLGAFEDSIATVSAIPSGAPFAPATNTPFTSFANITENGDPQVIKAGSVNDDPDTSWVDIGANSLWGGDGSVTALNGGVYQHEADDLEVYVGGWGASGTLNALGNGSTITFASGPDPYSQVSVEFGIDGGHGLLNVVNGVFQLQNAHSPATNYTRSYLGVGLMDGEAEIRVDNGSVQISGFETSYLSVGQWGGSGQIDLQNGSTLSMVPSEFARIWVGMFNNSDDDDSGVINVESGSRIVVDNLHELYVGVGDGWSDGRGQINITGAGSEFLATVAAADSDPDILIGDLNGVGTLNVSDGGRFALLPNGVAPVVQMAVGQAGNGNVQLNGGTVDLGGAATLKVGGVLDTSDSPGWGSHGSVSMSGEGSIFTGISQAWFGYDPNAPDQTGMQNNGGNLFLFGNSTFGNAGADIHLGEYGMLMWNGTPRIEGDVHLHGANIDSHGWANTATIDGDLNVVQGQNWVMMSATHLDDGVGFGDPGTPFVESWHITGAFNLQGGSLDLHLHSFWGYEFQRGETHQLITFGELIDGAGDFSASVSHFGEDDFARKMVVDQLVDGSVTFVALNDSNPLEGADPTLRHALLDFSAGNTALDLEYDAPDPSSFTPGQITWLGGGWYGGFSSENIDEIRGTGHDDLIDLTGLATGMEIHAGAGNDTLIGGDGDDMLMGGLGDDVIDGGGGVNTAVYTGDLADYLIATDADTAITTVTDNRAGAVNEGTDTLTNIHFLQFANMTHIIDLPVTSGPALTLDFTQTNGLVTITVFVDGALVSGDALTDLAFTLDVAPSLIGYVTGTASPGFTVTDESLIFDGSDLNQTAFDQPALQFDMQLTAVAGARDVKFELRDVSVNGRAMEDQTGDDGFDFTFDAAFFTLGGQVDIRDARAEPGTKAGTDVTFTASDGATYTATTDSAGNFTFGLLEAGTAGEVSLVRDYNATPVGVDKALGIQDVLGLFRMVVDVPGLTVDDTDIISGDFNGDTVVNIQDVLGLFRHVVGVPGAPEPEFLFVDESNPPTASLGAVPDLDGSFVINPITGDMDMSFLGILTGDLQGHL